MKLDKENLEQILQALTPRAPSAELSKRIEENLAQPVAEPEIAQHPSKLRWFVAAAAVLLVMATIYSLQPNDKQSLTEPAATTDTAAVSSEVKEPELVFQADEVDIYNVDEGIVFLGDNIPHRKLRRHFIKRYRWPDGKGHMVSLTEPAQEVHFISMESQ